MRIVFFYSKTEGWVKSSGRGGASVKDKDDECDAVLRSLLRHHIEGAPV